MQTEKKYYASRGKSLTNHLLCFSFFSDPPPSISIFLFFLSEPSTIYPAPPYLPSPCPQFSMFPSNSCLLSQPALSFHLSFASQCHSITNRNSLHPSLLSSNILDVEESFPHLLIPPSCSSALAENFPVSLILISTN